MDRESVASNTNLDRERDFAEFRPSKYIRIPFESKKAIKKGFQNQIDKKGFSIIEVVSTCPTNWGMTPVEALDWLRENMLPYYPLGVYKDEEKGARIQ